MQPKLSKTDKALLYHQRIIALLWLKGNRCAPPHSVEILCYFIGYSIYWKFTEELREKNTSEISRYRATGGSMYIRDIAKNIKNYTFDIFRVKPDLMYSACQLWPFRSS